MRSARRRRRCRCWSRCPSAQLQCQCPSNGCFVVCSYAFGTATQALPVPELMPFRLTRQLAGALAPHEAKEVLARPLGSAMGALRDSRAIIQVCIYLAAPDVAVAGMSANLLCISKITYTHNQCHFDTGCAGRVPAGAAVGLAAGGAPARRRRSQCGGRVHRPQGARLKCE